MDRERQKESRESMVRRWHPHLLEGRGSDGTKSVLETELTEQERSTAVRALQKLRVRHMLMKYEELEDKGMVLGGEDALDPTKKLTDLITSQLVLDDDEDEEPNGHNVYSFEDVAQGIVKLAMAQNAEDSRRDVSGADSSASNDLDSIKELQSEVSHLQTTHHRQLRHRAHARMEGKLRHEMKKQMAHHNVKSPRSHARSLASMKDAGSKKPSQNKPQSNDASTLVSQSNDGGLVTI